MFSTKLKMVTSLRQLKNVASINKRLTFVSFHRYISTNFSLLSENDHDHENLLQEADNIGKGNEPSSEDSHIQADLSVITNDSANNDAPSLKTVSVVPGKGPPPDPPVTCCMSGCANCVWIAYAEELKAYYGEGSEINALDHIEDPSLKAFIKLELGIKKR